MLPALFLTLSLAHAAPELVKIEPPKGPACASNLNDDIEFDEWSGTLHFRGHRIKLDRLFGGYQLIFALLRQPGHPVSVESLRGLRKSAHFENFRTLVLMFREIDPTFDGIGVRPGEGFVYRPGPHARDSHAPVSWKGMTVDWLKRRLDLPNGMSRPLNTLSAEILRRLFLAGGGPLAFDEIFAALYPGRDPGDKVTAFHTLGRELPEWLAKTGLRVTVDPVARTWTLSL